MIVVIDNYDSFTYNLVQYLYMIGEEVAVFRNDAVTLSQIEAMHPSGILLSPGPGTPDDAGITVEAIQYFSKKIPIFGVCLGHQAIARAFGGHVTLAKTMMHGKTSQIIHQGDSPLFRDIPSEFTAVRYHSLIVEGDTLPDVLQVTAVAEGDVIMAMEHKDLPVYGVQFHPEGVLTEYGMDILRNFVALTKKDAKTQNEAKGGVA